MKKAKILIAEDDRSNRATLLELLDTMGYEVNAVADGQQAIQAFANDKYDLVITDLRMPHLDGLELLKLIKDINVNAVAIIMTGYGTIHSAVEAMKLGAFDYITKPLKDDLVKLAVERAVP